MTTIAYRRSDGTTVQIPVVERLYVSERFERLHATARLDSTGTGWLHLSDVYVDEDHRRHGHGRALMLAVVAYADRLETDVYLHVVASNEAAIRLYESVGFTHEGVEQWIAHSCNVLRMERTHR